MTNIQFLQKKLTRISRQTGISLKKIKDCLLILSSGKPVLNNELLRRVGIARKPLNQIKKSLSFLLIPSSSQTQVRSDYLVMLQSLFEADYFPEENVWSFLKNQDYSRIVKLFNQYQNQQPASRRELDQFTATPETVARRACLLDFFEDIADKKILVLGDDDFTSVALASFGSALEVVVLEIDSRIIKGVSFVTLKENLEIKAQIYDARQPLPESCRNHFDIVLTDPPYTPAGIKLFLSRAIQALDPKNQAARIYLCFGASDRAKERVLPIYQILIESGLMTRWIFDKFNRYRGAESIGSTSFLIVAEVTPKTKPLIKGEFNGSIYTTN
ncbi:MAG: bis-aminopropyl spermidine synthase family protein [Candidatus Pacebacteria bacterium]|nr:bis-aminopropyl spermidine synthase family protein [Candidatus Paceibacterota bacterium]